MEKKKSVLFAASEGMPFVKSGGLADVIGSLPKVLKSQYDIRVVLPLYSDIIERWIDKLKKIVTFNINQGQKQTVASVYRYELDGVTYYFIEHQGYFERNNLYGYPDDGERFAFFDLAVTDMLAHLDYFPDIIHSNDWQTGMIPLLCKRRHPGDARYLKIRHVFTIHNILFQGNFPPEMLESCLGLPMELFDDGTVRQGRDMNFMKSAILFADKITTVSNNYAHEILTEQYGEGLEQILQRRSWDLWGIVNGIDTDMWNPATDKKIAKRYTVEDRKGKRECKRALQRQLGLRVSSDTMLVAMVSRLTSQKGVYLLIDNMYQLMGLDIQFIVLGTGDEHAENGLRTLEYRFPHRAVYYRGYNEELSHAIYAGADAFMMPSVFEPCGISQLISMRYGTLPIVRETGGLKDTVTPYNTYTGEGTGFSFKNATGDDILHVTRMATEVYYNNKDAWNRLVTNAMNKDVSWEGSAELYYRLYSSIL
ncbi:MAG: glycogen synthase GlgA [Erysipelotrichales bacterium]|nr:glycogen synthase GlgA [Erysipelotrichales bacterium]